MPGLPGAAQHDAGARTGRLRAGLVSVACLLRNLPLFFCAVPATPLRALCLVALDTIHVLRYSQPLSRQRRSDLAVFLDFQACTNAAWDRKPRRAAEHQALRRRVEAAGLERWMTGYLLRVGDLESRRPPIGGDGHRLAEVRAYREEVVRLSLATLVAMALDADGLDEGIRATECDAEVAAMFGMAMQCQVIDDVVDYREDLAAGLPSFLTASASLPDALTSTAHAVERYAAAPLRSPSTGVTAFPFEIALCILTLVAKFAVAAARTRHAGAPRARSRRQATAAAHSAARPEQRSQSR